MDINFQAFDPDPIILEYFSSKFSRICCRWCRVRRRDQEIGQNENKNENRLKLEKISNDAVGRETYMPSDQVKIQTV